MSYKTYTVDLGFDQIRIRADLAEAHASIYHEGENGWCSTGYQTADARHRAHEMAVMVIRSFGRDYWHDPSEDLPEDEYAYISALIESVESDADGTEESA